MKLFVNALIEVPTSDVERKDFRKIFIMAGISLIALAVIITL